jgi:Flp pilus assembly protein TadD
MAELDTAVEQAGETSALEAEQALALALVGRVAEGIARADAAIEKYPEAARLHAVKAAMLFQAGQAQAGAAATDRALELDPSELNPLRTRVQFRAATGQFAGALEDGRRYLGMRPHDSGVHFMLGVVNERSGRGEAAVINYRRAAELDVSAFAPRNNLADLLHRRGDLDGALEAAQEAYALADDNPYVADTLGWMYVEKGLVDRGVSLLEEAHAGAPEHPVVQLHLALAYRSAARKSDARELLRDLRPRTEGELRGQVDDALASLE